MSDTGVSIVASSLILSICAEVNSIKVYTSGIIDFGKLVSQSQEDVRLCGDDGAFGPVSPRLVLAGNDCDHPAVVLDK